MSPQAVFMFSGQGSQHLQMGRVLFDREPVFRECMMRLDALVQDSCGQSVIDALYSSGQRAGAGFDRTLLTHPAIFMVEYSLAETLMRAGVMADIALGTSLGSFAAATVAGVVGVEDALTAVIRQARALEDSCEAGGLFAVLADPALYADECLTANSEIAAVNFSSHFVIAAQQQRLVQIETRLRSRNVTYRRLPVSFAFHSRWIDEAQVPFESSMRGIGYRAAQLPIMCCADAALAGELRDGYFWRVIREPMRFREAVLQLERTGPHRYIDVGPSSTLATFLKYILPSGSQSTIHSILTPYGHDQRNLTELVAATRVPRARRRSDSIEESLVHS